MTTLNPIKINPHNIYWFLFFTTIILAFGLQVFGYDRDYANYYYYFDQNIDDLLYSDFEIGFAAIVISLKSINIKIEYFYFIFAFCSILPKLILIKKISNRKILPYILYFSPFIFLQDDTQIRCALGLALCAWGLFFLFNENKILGYFLFFISTLIHNQLIMNAALAVLFSFFFTSNESTSKKILFYLALMIITVISSKEIALHFQDQVATIFPKIDHYIINPPPLYTKPNPFNLTIIGNIMLSIWGMKIIFNKDTHTFYKISWILGVFGVFLYYALMNNGTLAFRISESFLFFNCLWIGHTHVSKNYLLNKHIGTVIVISLFVLNIYLILFNADSPYYFSSPPYADVELN